MKFEIIEIKAEGNICLSQEAKRIDPYHSIWYKCRKNQRELRGSRYPAAFILNRRKPAQLKVAVKVSRGLSLCNAILKAYYRTRLIFKSKDVKWNPGKRIALFDVYAIGTPKGFCRFAGELIWKLKWDEEPAEKSTYLELFWIYGDNKIFCGKGVPVEILRQAAFALQVIGKAPTGNIFSCPNKREKLEPSKDPVIEAIVHACFYRNPPAYNLKNTNPTFSECPFDKMPFKLHQYLNAIHNPNALCNCWDMAAAVQVYLKAVGFKDVKFCYIESLGYLRLTKLVGRGFCNNPVDIKDIHFNLGSELLADPTSKARRGFNSHCFCGLPDNEIFPQKEVKRPIECIDHTSSGYRCEHYRILDACIGPHVGKDKIDEYVKKTVDDKRPPNGYYRNPKNFEIYNGVMYINWNPKIEKPELPQTRAFKKLVKYKEKKVSHDENLVAYSWPEPEHWPVLDKKWKTLVFITPGVNEVQKTWILRKGGESIQIDLYVASPYEISPQKKFLASQAAQYRFLLLGSMYTQKEPPYKKGPSYLGPDAAKYCSSSFSQYFWTIYNVTFKVICWNASFDIYRLLKWLNKKAVSNSKKEDMFTEALPSVPAIPKKIKIGEILEIPTEKREFPKKEFIDFVCEEGDGIQLLKQENQKLIFQGVKKNSTNIITIVVVNEDTLLSNSKTITIYVEG